MTLIPRLAGLIKPRKGVKLVDRYYIPQKGDVVAPDAKGVTFDPNGDLDSWTWNTDGSVTVVVTPTTTETLPSNGVGVVLQWRDDYRRIATRSPAGYGVKGVVSDPADPSSGMTIAIGIAGLITGTDVTWHGINYDGTTPRSVAGANGTVGVSGSVAGATGWGGDATHLTAASAINDVQLGQVTTALKDAAGLRVKFAIKSSNIIYTGQTYLLISVWAHGAVAQQSMTFFPQAYIRQLAPGQRY